MFFFLLRNIIYSNSEKINPNNSIDTAADLQEKYRKIQEDYASMVKYKQMYKKERDAAQELRKVQKELTEVARTREQKLEEALRASEKAQAEAQINIDAASMLLMMKSTQLIIYIYMYCCR